ncbi:MAG: LacI family DNA-binding transcriptional regulator [Bacteroidales bacterium]|nr:LacI family DNA-binding transcriptional regulator [Candidatus Cryptobacteroides aphodequi]
MEKVTLSKIAESAGVSIGTASRVLSGKAEKYRISKETAVKVRAAARELSYKPLHIEANIKTDKVNLIGLVIPSLKNQYFAEMASVVITEAGKLGYSVIVFDSMEDEKVLFKAVSTLLEKKVDGMIIAPCGDDPMWLEQIDATLVPVVLIDRFYEDTTLSYVTTDNFSGAVKAVNYLIKNGHKNIACIAGVPSSMPNQERVAGYKKAMCDAGLEEYINVSGDDFTIRGGYLATKLLLQGPGHPTALFALAGMIMLGSLKAIREADLRVPEDISIISFDNYFYMDFMEPSLVRMDQPYVDICSLAVKILFEKMEKKRMSATRIRLSPNLIEGKSVALRK